MKTRQILLAYLNGLPTVLPTFSAAGWEGIGRSVLILLPTCSVQKFALPPWALFPNLK